jgi:hypothetical protein
MFIVRRKFGNQVRCRGPTPHSTRCDFFRAMCKPLLRLDAQPGTMVA